MSWSHFSAHFANCIIIWIFASSLFIQRCDIKLLIMETFLLQVLPLKHSLKERDILQLPSMGNVVHSFNSNIYCNNNDRCIQ